MKVAIIGVGIHEFGRTPYRSGLEQGAHAARLALVDAGIEWKDIQFAYGGSHSAGKADSLVSQLGLTGIPFVNVANGCATGGISLIAAASAILSGRYEIGMVVGFDKHARGAFNPNPASAGLGDWYGETGMMVTTQFFAMKTQRYLHEYGLSRGLLAKVAAKSFRNGALAEHAWRRQPVPEETIAGSAMLSDPLTKYMFCSPAEGGVALVIASAKVARKYTRHPIFVEAAEMRTREFGSFEVFSPWIPPNRVDGPTSTAAQAAFESSGVSPADVRVAQIQDTEAGAEIMHMAETGLCAHGDQERLIVSGETEISGRLPINTDGGCIANGEPIGASGLRQVYENVVQLRGTAGRRQVPDNPSIGFSHVYGAPGVSACTVVAR